MEWLAPRGGRGEAWPTWRRRRAAAQASRSRRRTSRPPSCRPQTIEGALLSAVSPRPASHKGKVFDQVFPSVAEQARSLTSAYSTYPLSLEWNGLAVEESTMRFAFTGLLLISQAAAVTAFYAVPFLGENIAHAGPAHARCDHTHRIFDVEVLECCRDKYLSSVGGEAEEDEKHDDPFIPSTLDKRCATDDADC